MTGAKFGQFIVGDAGQFSAGFGRTDFFERRVRQADELAVIGNAVHVAEAGVEIGQGLHGQKPVDDIAKFWRERGHSVEEGPWREMRINIDDHNRTSGGGDSLCLP